MTTPHDQALQTANDIWKAVNDALAKNGSTKIFNDEMRERIASGVEHIFIHRETALILKISELKTLLCMLSTDYDHPWPDEDQDTKEHRERRMTQMNEAIK